MPRKMTVVMIMVAATIVLVMINAMDTDVGENESGNDYDGSSNSFGDDNCSGKDTDSDYENIDLDVFEKIEEARV